MPRCPHCRADVARNRRACPSCGHRPSHLGRVALAVALGLAFVLWRYLADSPPL